MTEEQIKEWLLAEEAVKCAFGDHSNHTHRALNNTLQQAGGTFQENLSTEEVVA